MCADIGMCMHEFVCIAFLYLMYIYTYIYICVCVCVIMCFKMHGLNYIYIYVHMWPFIKFRELISVNVLHTSLLNTTVVAFKILLLGSYAPMPAPSSPFKTILELVLWNGRQSKIPSFQYFL